MKIGMQTWGSHGDIRPFLALAEGLQAAGNDVHLVITCADGAVYSDYVSAHGIRLTVLATPVLTAAQQGEIARLAYTIRNPLEQIAEILRLCFAPVEDLMFASAQDLCADADLLIGHYFMHPLQIAAELAGRPYVSTLLSHGGLPSAYTNPIGLPVGKAGNRFLWWLTRTLITRAIAHYPNRLRRQLGMPPTTDIINQVWLSKQLTLAAVSPQLCVAQPDWPASVQVCGFLDTPNLDMEGKLPDAMASFLQAGEAPVYMTLGSWMPKDSDGQAQALYLLTQAARLSGCRAIIQGDNARACGYLSDQQILYISAAPHHAIFPRCRAVVHHGGAGTTQSATLAGRPSIVVAHISEQEHWGAELRRVGIAGKPLQRRSLTAAALAKQIRRVTPEMARKAHIIGDAMKQENGVAVAVRLIMRTFA